jgi:hypothetical protein
MRKISLDLQVLLNIKPREEWQAEILKKLDLRPLAFDDLAKEFGFEKHSREYKDLSALISGLQRNGENGSHIKTAITTKDWVYPLYRADQEEELIQKGVLSEKEYEFKPSALARDYGMGRDEIVDFLISLER